MKQLACLILDLQDLWFLDLLFLHLKDVLSCNCEIFFFFWRYFPATYATQIWILGNFRLLFTIIILSVWEPDIKILLFSVMVTLFSPPPNNIFQYISSHFMVIEHLENYVTNSSHWANLIFKLGVKPLFLMLSLEMYWYSGDLDSEYSGDIDFNRSSNQQVLLACICL